MPHACLTASRVAVRTHLLHRQLGLLHWPMLQMPVFSVNFCVWSLQGVKGLAGLLDK